MSHRSGKCPQRAVIGSRLSDSSHWTPEEEGGGVEAAQHCQDWMVPFRYHIPA